MAARSSDHGVQRRGARIIGIVDDGKSFFEPHHFPALVRWRKSREDTRCIVCADSPHTRRRERCQRIHHVVTPDQRQSEPRASVRAKRNRTKNLRCRSRRCFPREIPRAGFVPKRITRPRATSANRATRSSSAFKTAVAFGHGKFSISSRSARAISSIEEKNSKCSTATRVITPTSGEAMRVRAASSPLCDIPSSTTAASNCGSSLSRSAAGHIRYSGFLASSGRGIRDPKSAARISLVVVLPTEPATPPIWRFRPAAHSSRQISQARDANS